MRELSKNERDFFLMGKLQVGIRDTTTVSHARSEKKAKKQRLSCQYSFDHRVICQNAFCYIHDIGNYTLRALRKHISECGPVPRQHGNKGRKAYNAYPFEVVSNAVKFIRNYGCLAFHSQLLLEEELTQLLLIYQHTRTTLSFTKSIVKRAVRNMRNSWNTAAFLIRGISAFLTSCL